MSQWEEMLYDFMTNPNDENASWGANSEKNWCTAAALGGWDFSNGTDAPAGTSWWGCSDPEGKGTDQAWAKCNAPDQERPIAQDDGSEKSVNIIEFSTVIKALKHDLKSGPLENGIWIGGIKHTLTRKDIETGQNNEYSFLSFVAAQKDRKGFVVVCTNAECTGKGCVLLAGFSEKDGCPASVAKTVALDFAKWLSTSKTDQSF